MKHLKQFVCIIILFVVSSMATAQIRFTTNCPKVVSAEEPFRVSYEVNSTDVSSFSQPTFSGLECLNGPAVSVRSSSVYQNGHLTSQQSTTYTYMLMATKAGTYRIPAASVSVNGKTYQSQATTIKVSATTNNSHSSSSSGQANNRQSHAQDEIQPAGSSITNRDLFLTVTTNKRKVFEQEPVVLTYKVHSRVGVGLRNIMPKKKTELDGFLTQEVELPSGITPTTATHNGVLYKEGIFRQYVIFPQATGQLKIPSLAFDCEVLQQNVSLNAIDAFFNGAGMLSVRVERTSPEMQLEVLPLPQPKPENFSGGVGTLTINGELLTSNPLTHEPGTYRITLTGAGNMKLIKAPKVEFPKDFETFDPKITDETQLTAEGVAGKIIYDYTFVPSNEGEYVIPAVEFVYFDSETNNYKTIKSAPITLNVKKGKHTAADWEKERRYRESDIAPINTQARGWRDNGYPNFWGSAQYWGHYVILLILCVVIIRCLSKYMKQLTNLAGQRNKHAGKVALKLLSQAETLITRTDNRQEFYAVVAQAINGYLMDKFALSASELSRDKIIATLRDANCEESVMQNLKEVMDTCEYAQFAPNSDVERHLLLQKAVQLIQHFEQSGAALRFGKSFRSWVIVVMAFCSLHLMAHHKAAGDSAYNKANYTEAIKHYEAALKQNADAVTYYNLGCAYYRLQQIPQAVLSFERSAMLNPADENTRFNIEICRHRIVDRFNRTEEMFFITYMKDMIASHSAGQWGIMALWLFAFTLTMFAVYWFGQKVWLRKLAFFTALIAFLACISLNVFAGIQHYAAGSQTKAVVFTQDNVYSSSTEGAKPLRQINPGTTVIITDKNVKGWYGIRLPNDTEGWVRSNSLEVI